MKYRHDPFLASTAYTSPIIIPYLGGTLLVRTYNFSTQFSVLQKEIHPLHLQFK